MNWKEIEKSPGKYDFGKIEKVINVLAAKGISITAAPLVNFVPENTPDWLQGKDTSFTDIQEAVYGFISECLSRFRKLVNQWVIVRGINCSNCLKLNLEQILEITRSAFIAARNGDNSQKLIQICDPWGSSESVSYDNIPPNVFLDMMIQQNIWFDALSIEMDMWDRHDYPAVRDLLQISAKLDSFAALGKPVFISDLKAPHTADETYYGYWEKEWSEEVQAKWLELVYKIALSKPFVSGVSYASIVDGEGTPKTGLLNSDYEPLKAYRKILRLQKT